MNKKTSVLNPNGIDFPMRCGALVGQPMFSSAKDLTVAIEGFYETGNFGNFDELKKNRNELISKITNWNDGYNHVRVGNEIMDLLDSKEINNDLVVDVRLICSSSKDLKKEIEIGNFREDLYHRINVFEINIEPLNQRISDIPLLIKYFSQKISENYNIKELNI